MSAAEWIAKRREHLTAAAAANRHHVSLPFDQREVNHMAVALEALEAVLAIETAHISAEQQPFDRDYGEGWNDALSTVRHAIEAALEAKS